MSNWYDEDRRLKESSIGKQEEQNREKRQFLHDWKIAIFSALAGALLSEPVWWIIRKIIGA